MPRDRRSWVTEGESWVPWIERELERRNWSIGEFSRRLNIPRGQATHWTRGRRKPMPLLVAMGRSWRGLVKGARVV